MKWSALAGLLVPAGVVTVMSTVPVPAGAVASRLVDVTFTGVTAFAPNFTDVAPARLTPVIVTVVPPLVGPTFGLTPVTVGIGSP